MANFTANLVANKITSDLLNRINDGKVTAYPNELNLYISNSGNNIPMSQGGVLKISHLKL